MQPVERSNPDGVDFGWVMQVTFVTTIVVCAPIVAALSTQVALPTWGARVEFAIRVGAVFWILTAVPVYVYAKRTNAGDGGGDPDEIETDAEAGTEAESGQEVETERAEAGD